MASWRRRGQQPRHDSSEDASPPRRGQQPRHDSSDDASPPRRSNANAAAGSDRIDDGMGGHAAVPRHGATGSQGGRRGDSPASDSDAGPPRRGDAATGTKRSAAHDSDDLSPPRKRSST